MAIELTDIQKRAVKEQGNILVAAAAGSGKTAVLVERVINMLTRKENPVSADRLLIVTFTNAAAAEMRLRIEKRLNEECEKNPEDLGLLKQKLLLSSADICTIDSFCINLVREKFEICGVEPSFKIGDETMVSSIKLGVLSEITERLIAENSSEFLQLLNILNCEYDEKNLNEVLLSIYDYIGNLPFPDKFLDNLLKPYEIPFDKGHPWYDEAVEYAENLLLSSRILIEKMADDTCFITKNQEKCQVYTESLSSILNNLIDGVETKNWNSFRDKLFTSNIPRLPSTDSSDPYAADFKSKKDEYVKNIKILQEIFCKTTEENDSLNKRLFPAVKLLIDTEREFKESLFEKLKEENTFTFSDIEQLALNLLMQDENGEHIGEIRNKYDEVLVDEFQDVNDLQNMLFKVLSNNEEHLFAVGDVKQSIYAFRGANPDNFLNKKISYTPVDKASKNDGKKIILSDNFRSKKGICDFINFFFSHLMTGEVGGIKYDEEEYLYAKGIFPETNESPVDLLICDKTDDELYEDRLHFEGRCIGEYIKSVKESGKIIRADKDELREPEYRDFVILLDSMKKKAPIIAEELTALNIPVSLSAESFKESSEVAVFLSLLKVIDNPQSDVELLNVLMSPLFAFSAEEIAIIKIPNKRSSLFSAIVNSANSGNKKSKDFLESVSNMRNLAAVMPLGRLITRLLSETDYLNIVSAMDNGDVRRENLLTVKRLAENYEKDFSGGIHGFYEYINALPEKSVKTKLSNQNSVRIMSMHASKGLQFPICILGNLAGKINNTDSFGNILFDDDLGLGIKYIDDSEEIITTVGHPLISKKKYLKNIEERMRLLYVALTRAEDKLCLVSSSPDAYRTIGNIASSLSDKAPRINGAWLKSTKNMNEWVLAAALLHPESDKLKAIYDVSVSPDDDKSHLNIIVMNKPFDKIMPDELCEDEPDINRVLADKIKENTEYVYPFESLREIQAKSSVSLLANKAESDRFAFSERPDFMFESGLSSAAKGTAMHHIMQFIDITKNIDVEAELDRLCEWQFISEAERRVADIDALKIFFKSHLFKRILNSGNVKREMRFLSEVKASSIDKNLSGEIGDTEVIIQGAVDLCFEEEDGIVIVDFKTDRAQTLDELKNTYGEQLEIYSKACEKIFEKRVKERIIYSFHLSNEIVF